MPAKKNGIISYREARAIAYDPAAMRKAILALQIECGDRVDDPRSYLALNQSEAERGYRQIDREEFEDIRAIIRKLLDAYARRSRLDNAVV